MTRCSMTGCAGEYEHRKVTHTVRRADEIIVIDGVPADVCSDCGDVLLDPETVRGVERLLSRRTAPSRTAPIYEYEPVAGQAA